MPVSYRVRLNCREEVTADVLERARELRSEVEPEDMTKLQHSHDKTLMDEELLCMDDLESTAGEEAAKIVGITTKDLEYHINLVDKVVGQLRIGSHFERRTTAG